LKTAINKPIVGKVLTFNR